MYDLNKHYQSNKKEILKSIDKILNKGVLEMGEEVEKFEESFSRYCGVKYSITVSSGSMVEITDAKDWISCADLWN